MNHHVRTELGAYVLGALDPDDRRAVEAHVAECRACRDELASLSAVRPLLDRIGPHEVVDLVDAPPALDGLRDDLVALEHRRLQRRVRVWQAAAAAASLVAVLVGLGWWAPWEGPPDRLVATVAPVADEAATTEGTIAAYAWEWGTTVEVRVQDLPPRSGYVLWAVAEDGRREQAGTWGATGDGTALVRGASAIARPDLQRVEVTDVGGTVLLDASFEGPVATR